MKNGESHWSKKQVLQKQALQTQGELFLPSVTKALSKLGYLNPVHQRLSKQVGVEQTYQGLTRATNNKLDLLMIKWEISADIYYDLTSLGQEIKVHKALNISQIKAQNFINISPQILADKSLIITVLNKNYQLTLLVMPYYSQGSLAEYLKQLLTDKQKQQLIFKVAQLISNLHSYGWLHNDIKPSNILVNDDHSLVLTDFALAELINSGSEDQRKAKNSAGTPAYLAPERWQGQGATIQSDIYAFGIMMYEILVGARPFTIDSPSSNSLKDWAIQHCQQSIVKLPDQHSHYQHIVDKALAKFPQNRYQNMRELVVDLQSLATK